MTVTVKLLNLRDRALRTILLEPGLTGSAFLFLSTLILSSTALLQTTFTLNFSFNVHFHFLFYLKTFNIITCASACQPQAFHHSQARKAIGVIHLSNAPNVFLS